MGSRYLSIEKLPAGIHPPGGPAPVWLAPLFLFIHKIKLRINEYNSCIISPSSDNFLFGGFEVNYSVNKFLHLGGLLHLGGRLSIQIQNIEQIIFCDKKKIAKQIRISRKKSQPGLRIGVKLGILRRSRRAVRGQPEPQTQEPNRE